MWERVDKTQVILGLPRYDAEEESCSFPGVEMYDITVDGAYASGSGSSLHFAAMGIPTYSMKSKTVSRIDVYIANGKAWEPYFDTEQLSTYVCEVMANQCEEVFAMNGFASFSSCVSQVKELHFTDEEGYLDGQSIGCLVLHSVLASENSFHCPHISLIPMEDGNGETKCQVSSRLDPLDIVTQEQIDFFDGVLTRQGIDPSLGIKPRCVNSDTWRQDGLLRWRNCDWVTRIPSVRCALASGAMIACDATCDETCA